MSYSDFIPHYDNLSHTMFEIAARTCKDGDIMVEVGAFMGHATCYMAECLVAYDKRPKLYAIDMWDEVVEPAHGENRTGLMPWGNETIADWRARGGRLYDSFRFYVDGCPFRDRIYDFVQFPAKSCMQDFDDDSVSWVFLNYTQDELAVQQEVTDWFPKLKSGGLIQIAARGDAPLRSLQKA